MLTPSPIALAKLTGHEQKAVKPTAFDLQLKPASSSMRLHKLDRYFISQVANKIVEIRDGELILYRGDDHYYLDKIAEEKDKANLEAIEAEKEAKRLRNALNKRKKKNLRKHKRKLDG